MFKFIFNSFISKKPRILDCKKVVFVGPHPDDIEVACGGTVAELVQRGIAVEFIICTDDRYSMATLSGEECTKLRQSEAIKAANYLGVTQLHFLNFADGGLWRTEDMAKVLAIKFAQINADLIFVPDPHMRDECHFDHIKVGSAASGALIMSSFEKIVNDLGGKGVSQHKGVAYYYTDRPNTYFKVSRKNANRKITSIHMHESQFFGEDKRLVTLYTKFRLIRFGFRAFSRYAEGYRVLNNNHIHCVTEGCD